MFFSSREVNDVGSLALGIVQEMTEVRFNEVGVFVADVVYGLHRVHDVQTMQTCERNASNEGFRNTPLLLSLLAWPNKLFLERYAAPTPRSHNPSFRPKGFRTSKPRSASALPSLAGVSSAWRRSAPLCRS